MNCRHILPRFRNAAAALHLRAVVAWCLPALIAGAVLRAALTMAMPYGYYHPDTPDFLTTPDRLLFQHRFELHMKKTFLTPVFFTIPFLLHVPALIAVPAMQHLLGLAFIVMTGVLCRFWFVHWKWFIIPVTSFVALDPAILWYEHTLMAETLFVVATVLLALAGTLYAPRPSLARFVLLGVALVLEAGARPEGKLLFGFGILLVLLVHFHDRRLLLQRLAAVLGLAVVTHFATKTSQAGLLLFTSVARLIPERLYAAPGLEPHLAEERAALQQRWDELRLFPKVNDRRAISAAVEKYLTAQRATAVRSRHRSVNDLCQKLAAETCLRQAAALPAHVYWKFRLTANDAPNGLLDEEWLQAIQAAALADDSGRSLRLSRGLIGTNVSSIEEWKAFVKDHYPGVPWFDALSARWFAALNAWRLPDVTFTNETTSIEYRGLPCYFLFAAAGLALIAVRASPLRRFHLAWSVTLAAFFFAIILTANVKPRFRFVFEPFWPLYLAALLDSVLRPIRKGIGKPQARLETTDAA